MNNLVYPMAATSWDQREIDAMHSVIDSGQFTMGPKVREFEAAFADRYGKSHAIMTNSGSSANLLSVAALRYRRNGPCLLPGDEVLVPAISWITTYTPLHQYGAKMKVVDVDLETLNVDMKRLEAAITDKTKMIMAVSILGNPAAVDQMRNLADKNSMIFMEDNCESLDASIDDRATGTFGDLSTASFFFSHHISTMEGGMILTDDDELADLCRALRAHGWTRDLSEDSLLYQKRGNEYYEAYRFLLPGYNVRPLELSAAIGLIQLEKLDEMTRQRRENWELFQSLFADDPRFIIQKEKHGRSSAFSFTLVLAPQFKQRRDEVFAALTEAGIGFRIVTGGSILRHEVCEHMDISAVDEVDNANYVHDFGFFVGNHPKPLGDEIHLLRQVLSRTLD